MTAPVLQREPREALPFFVLGPGQGPPRKRVPCSSASTAFAPPKAALNLRVFAALCRYIDATFGRSTLASIAEKVGVEPEHLLGASLWVSHAQAETLLNEARELVPDDETFKTACAFQLESSYGPLLWALRALTPQAAFATACRTMGLVSRISTLALLESAPNRVIIRYASTAQESRAMCLSRTAHLGMMPTFYGLPPAILTERACLALGDDCCEYEFAWFAHRRWFPALVGALAGGAFLAGAYALGMPLGPTAGLAPLLTATLAHMFELQRTNRTNRELGDKSADALREMAHQDLETRKELLALSRRESEWSSAVERTAAQRHLAMERIVSQLTTLNDARQSALRGVTHDLRNPLFTMSLHNTFLKEYAPDLSDDLVAALEEQEANLDRLRTLLVDLMRIADSGSWLAQAAPTPIRIEDLAEELGRRARALVHGERVETRVAVLREAPPLVVADRKLLNRVADSLLMTAASGTVCGSISVELDGRPGFFLLKVSDTGRGIDDAEIRAVLSTSNVDESFLADSAVREALAVAGELLAQLGGRLEVFSKPGMGTTLCAYFPVGDIKLT